MAERYLFFNAMEIAPDVYDREYQAQDFAEYFGDVLSTGLMHTNEVPAMSVEVEAGTLNTVVNPGKAILRGHKYENTTPLTLSHSIPEPNLDRIDRVILRLNLNNSVRDIRLRVLEGESSANPTAPVLTRTQFIHDISLAQIRVKANTSSLDVRDLTDERLIEDLCGLVYSLISIPTSQFQAQWDLFFADKSAEVTASADVYMQSLLAAEQQLQDGLASYDQQWLDWFGAQQTEGYVLQPEFVTHTADNTAHGIGNKATLQTTEKGTIVGAVNELFTNVSNGKSLIGGAITDIDASVIIPTDPTFFDLASAINSIELGASGAITSSSGFRKYTYVNGQPTTDVYNVTVGGLGFKPSVILLVNKAFKRTTIFSAFDDGFDVNTAKIFNYGNSSSTTALLNIKVSSPLYVFDGGFSLPVSAVSQEFEWYAYV